MIILFRILWTHFLCLNKEEHAMFLTLGKVLQKKKKSYQLL